MALAAATETATHWTVMVGRLLGGLAVTLLLRRLLLCRQAAGIELLAGTAVRTRGLIIIGAGALGNRAVLIACLCEFVCQCVTDECACRRADQALQQPAASGLVVNILLSVCSGHRLTIVAVSLRFGRNGIFHTFRRELVNRIVLLLGKLLLERFDLFLLLLKLGLGIVFAGGKSK